MNKRAIRLQLNLFNTQLGSEKNDERKKSAGVRNSIIELNKAITGFVSSPVFKSDKLIDPKDVEKSENHLEKIIKLSHRLSAEARELIK